MNWKYLLLGGTGRIPRTTYLIGLLPILVLFALVGVFLTSFKNSLPDWAGLLVAAVFALEGLYFLAMLSIKRMHDYGRSKHYLWLFFSPLIVAALFLLQQKFFHLKSYEGAVVIYTMLISLALIGFFWMLVEMAFRRSDEDTNKFGAPPAS